MSFATASPVPDGEIDPQGNPVSWQSAFWALVPFAMNSMTQPAGMVCFLPSKYGAILRCSPIICAIDTIFILELLLWNTIATRSPFLVCKQFVNFRFQDETEEDDGSFKNLQKNTVFRLGMFILGTLPQVIKLYSMTGLLWEKIAGGVYLSSFVIVEVVTFIARFGTPLQQNQPPPRIGQSETTIAYVAVIFSLLYSVHLFSLGFISATLTYGDRIRGWHVLLLVLTFAVYFFSNLFRPRHTLGQVAALVGSIFTTILASFLTTNSYGTDIFMVTLLVSEAELAGFLEHGVVLWALLSSFSTFFIVSFAGFSMRSNDLVPRIARIKRLDIVISWTFLLLQVIGAIMFLVFRYDSNGTSKPTWAEVLG